MLKNLKLVVSCIVLLTGLFVVGVDAQRTKKTISLNPVEPEASSYDLDQCRNGAVEDDGFAPDCQGPGSGSRGWVNGSAGNSNSHWAEGQFIAYRLRFSGLSTGTHTLVLAYDVIHSDVHAIDYLGSYNVTETDANACSTLWCDGLVPTESQEIPVDGTVAASINPNTGLPITYPGVDQRQMMIWGGTITSITYDPLLQPFAADQQGKQERRIVVTFVANRPDVVLAWGGHIAWRGDWGANNSAGGISGNPYHMRVLELDGSGGNQDRALSADAVDASGGVIIVKKVETTDNTDESNQAFTFNASAFFPNTPTNNVFQLVDDAAGADGVGRTSAPIFQEAGQFTFLTVDEEPTLSWTLLDISCNDANSTGDVATRTASITVDGTEIVTCTFVNGQQNASASSASLAGRVLTSTGAPISGATIMIQNLSTGTTQYLLTNSYGRYATKGLPVGDFYAVTVMHRRYSFPDPTRYFTLEDNLSDMDFTSR